MALRIRWYECVSVTFPVLMIASRYMTEGSCFRNYTPKHSGVIGQHVNNVLFNGSEKNILVLFLQFF